MSVKTGIYCLLTFAFLSCHRSTQPSTLIAKKQPESFSVFFDQFNSDSTFQRSRVVFPLDYYSVTEESTDYELINQPIDSSEYLILDLNYDDSIANQAFDAYKRIIQTTNDTTWVKFTGIENGIHEEFIFALRKGKWFLVKAVDAST